MPALLVQRASAPHDPSGNPRRLWYVYAAETGETLAVLDEGYGGRRVLIDHSMAAYRAPELPGFNVTATEYRDALRNRCRKCGRDTAGRVGPCECVTGSPLPGTVAR